QNDRWHDAAVHWQRVADIRSLEPTGLIQLATAQIHLQQWQDARATLKKLQSRDWPSRFGNVDATVEQLLRQIPAAADK
ncbi:MAG: hypothetical protein JW829_09975, partial [Pirellulales bacterium]|nr:hypothetical protein [Pirellulales bacterium]